MLAAEIDGTPTTTEVSGPETGGEVASRLVDAAMRSWVHQLVAGQISGIVVTIQVQHHDLSLAELSELLVKPPRC